MKTRTCSICGIAKPETREYFYFRNDSQGLRKDCKSCILSVKERKNKRKAGVKWDFEKTKQLFLDNNLIPLLNEFDGYISATKKITAVNQKGYKVWISIDKLRVGKTPNSFSKFNPFTVENIKLYLKRETDEYQLLSTNYQNNQTKLTWKCNSDHVFKMTWGDFQCGKRCSKCSGVYKRTNEEFRREVFGLVGDEYTFLEDYKNVDEKIKVIHNKCSHRYEVTPYKFINTGQRCPKCNESKGEKKVEIYLKTKDVPYVTEYSFPDCKNIFPLRFDFAVFDKQGELSLLIEYDGKQHFRPYKYYGGEKEFELVKKRDAIKNNYCEENNINLVRIPYTKYHEIEDILATHL